MPYGLVGRECFWMVTYCKRRSSLQLPASHVLILMMLFGNPPRPRGWKPANRSRSREFKGQVRSWLALHGRQFRATSSGECFRKVVEPESRATKKWSAEVDWRERRTLKKPHPRPPVDLYFLDGGYCGVQPVDLKTGPGSGRINACAMVRADVASTLSDVFQYHPALLDQEPAVEVVRAIR